MSTMEGTIVNGYTLKSPLGKGGMAEVWLAENELGMQAAVKILSDELSRNEQMQERFLNEAKVMVKLDHPNIRKVYGYGKIDGRPCIIMEYLDGNDLKARLKRGQRFTDQELQKWWNQLVDALNYTHAQNIVHRDIKPSNIFIDHKGDVKLLDFGIAKVTDTTTGTQTGSTLGTRIYMSPEQVKDPKRVGTKSDVYSLAVSFVHLLTGKAPYDSTTSSDYDIQVSIVTKPIDLSPLPQAWQGFLAPYLEKDPEKRPDLRPFEVVPLPAAVDEGTLADDSPSMTPTPVNNPSTKTPHSGLDPLSPALIDKSTSKKSLWIALGAAAAIVVLLLLLLKPKSEPTVSDPDTLAFQACQNIDDYRTYMRNYGRNALHYDEAKAFVDQYETDSINRLTDSLNNVHAQQIAQQKVETEQKAQAETEKKEDEAFKKCTTIAACDSYLKTYPQGRYVDKVKIKRQELVDQKEKSEAVKAALQPLPMDIRGSLAAVFYFNKASYTIQMRNRFMRDAHNASIEALSDLISKYSIKRFGFRGWGSPEEAADDVPKRIDAVKTQIKKIIQKAGLDENDFEYVVEISGSDGDWFMTQLSNSNIKDKAQIQQMLMNSSNKEADLDTVLMMYPQIEKEILPQLRRVEVYVY